MPRKKPETPGAKAERERLARERESYLAYMRGYNRARNRVETVEFRKGKRKFQEDERKRDEVRAKSYDAFIRRYGTQEQRDHRKTHEPTKEQVANWWDSRGKAARWIGPDSLDSADAHPTKPAEKPRRQQTTGDLIGGWFANDENDDPGPDPTPPSGGGSGGGGGGDGKIFGGGMEGLGFGGSNDAPPEDNGPKWGGLW